MLNPISYGLLDSVGGGTLGSDVTLRSWGPLSLFDAGLYT